MPRHTGVSWTPWSRCERCSFQYPVNQLVNQNGVLVCTQWCFDNQDIKYRAFIIEQVLASTDSENVPVTPELQWNPEEIYF